MTAGTNMWGNFLRLTYTSDDDVGGADPTGTILHEHISGRIEEIPANTLLTQQGLETKKQFTGVFWGHQLSFREQDQFEVTSPPNHAYYGKRFRVIRVNLDSNHPAQKRNTWGALLEREQIAHREALE